MFSGILFEDYKKLYNEYCFTGNGKVTYKEAQPVLAYAEKHTNTTFKTFLQMFFLQTVLSGEVRNDIQLFTACNYYTFRKDTD